jgi:hypothetical protein
VRRVQKPVVLVALGILAIVAFRHDWSSRKVAAPAWFCKPGSIDPRAIIGKPGIYSSLEQSNTPDACDWLARDFETGNARVVGTIPHDCADIMELAFSPDGTHGLAVVGPQTLNLDTECSACGAWEVDFLSHHVAAVQFPVEGAHLTVGYDSTCNVLVFGDDESQKVSGIIRRFLDASDSENWGESVAWVRKSGFERLAVGTDAANLQNDWTVRIYRGVRDGTQNGEVYGLIGTPFESGQMDNRGFGLSPAAGATLSSGLVWVSGPAAAASSAFIAVWIAGVPDGEGIWRLRARARIGAHEIARAGTSLEIHVRVDDRWILFEDTQTGARPRIVDRRSGTTVWSSDRAIFVTAWPSAEELQKQGNHHEE